MPSSNLFSWPFSVSHIEEESVGLSEHKGGADNEPSEQQASHPTGPIGTLAHTSSQCSPMDFQAREQVSIQAEGQRPVRAAGV